MKDQTHHLKHVQRKVIQAARKEELNTIQSAKSGAGRDQISVQETRVFEPPRHKNRLPGYIDIH